jgi:tRNA uridine 5-carboxymethylaminomethyl modification enzyme
VDDLITKGTKEPYRMFTSRAEFRILLRQDNADIRLSPIGFELGLLSQDRYQNVLNKVENTEKIKKIIGDTSVLPEEVNELLASKESALITQSVKANSILLRPHISLNDLLNNSKNLKNALTAYLNNLDELMQAEIQLKYAGYIEREGEMANKLERLEDLKIPESLNYFQINSISAEAKEKLSKVKPVTIGQASRISGISPADISVLLIYMGR